MRFAVAAMHEREHAVSHRADAAVLARYALKLGRADDQFKLDLPSSCGAKILPNLRTLLREPRRMSTIN
eukprot:4018364-Pleurochrysis_carterae.AAC.1